MDATKTIKSIEEDVMWLKNLLAWKKLRQEFEKCDEVKNIHKDELCNQIYKIDDVSYEEFNEKSFAFTIRLQDNDNEVEMFPTCSKIRWQNIDNKKELWVMFSPEFFSYSIEEIEEFIKWRENKIKENTI